MTITKGQINEAAHTLRLLIDLEHDRITNSDIGADADEETKDAYDAVTLLHEAAMEGRG